MIKRVIYKSIQIINLAIFKKKWKEKNKHNFTTVKNIFPIEKVSVGKNTYGLLQVNTYGNPREKLIIGSYCSIAGNVKFLLGGEHSYTSFSTYPFNKYICGLEESTLTKGPIIIKDDVWIGEETLVLSGVTIGQGAIIAAGSVVAKDVPPYAIYAGGKILKYRFSEDIIKKMLEIDFTKLSETNIKKHIDFLYMNITDENINTNVFEKLEQLYE